MRSHTRTIRIIIGSLMTLLGVLALALLVLVVYAAVTRTMVGVGTGTFDIAVGPYPPDESEHQIIVGQPLNPRAAPVANQPECSSITYHKLPLGWVGFYLNTCDHWSNQPFPTPVPTQVQPLPVYTGIPKPLPSAQP
ncbi:MAG: hypothetical protein ABI670_13925 [Chloroflexota bacterium]